MRALALGEAATHLPWLSPCAASLAALARSPAAAAWDEVRTDPGAVLLVVRQAAAKLALPSVSFFPALLNDPAILEGAIRHLDHCTGFVAWDRPDVAVVYRACLTYAHLSHHLAELAGCCDPDNAWVAGLLAPLGWLAVCAVAPDQAAACLADPELAHNPVRAQQRCWGFDHACIARRVARRWQLPRWLSVIVGHLDLAAETAQMLGAEAGLFRVTQLAVGLAQRDGVGLNLPVGATPAECAAALGLETAAVAAVEGRLDVPGSVASSPPEWTPPENVPLLRDLLVVAADNRRSDEAAVLECLESKVDHLHRALQEQRAAEAERLQTLKLNALAEFAAGAGHEINNPLAVISGQAQYLLHHEPEAPRQRALQTIIGQAHRIHQILSELMLFARPPRPQKQDVDVAGMVRAVAGTLTDLAIQRRVQLVCSEPERPVRVHADPGQAHTALACLLRNAVEAAPAEGWAAVRVDLNATDRIDFVVEDNGGGPAEAQREHLFDPFFSGRQAGRGRGLGLPTAWRLAQENGGDVRWAGAIEGPTRFILSLPREEETASRAAPLPFAGSGMPTVPHPHTAAS